MIGYYFVRRRAFANALSSTGTALGLSVLPLLANFLRGWYGWRGSFMIFGAILLNCCVCGAVLRPLQPSARRGSRWQRRQSDHAEPDRPDGHPPQREPEGLKRRLRDTLSGLMAFLHRHMGFDLLRSNPRYRAFTLSVAWMMLGFTVPLVYLVPYATSHGMDQDRAALLMSILGLVNILVRPVVALVFGLPRFRGSRCFVYMFAAAILVNGLSNCVCAAAASFPVLLAFVVLFGLSMSFIGSLLVTVLMDTVDIRRFHSALGLICCMESFTVLMGPPLAGLLAILPLLLIMIITIRNKKGTMKVWNIVNMYKYNSQYSSTSKSKDDVVGMDGGISVVRGKHACIRLGGLITLHGS